MSLRYEIRNQEDRPLGVCVWGDRTLPDGTRVSWGLAQWTSGQVVGGGWCVVRINDGRWESLDWRSGLRLRRAIEACDTAEELRVLVVEGRE